MHFQESVKTCLSKFATFDGRAGLSEYWWFMLFLVGGHIIVSVASRHLASLFGLVTLLPSLAAGARRLHDTNRSGWLQLFWIIPVIGWILMIYFLVQEPKEPNRFGSTSVAPANSQTL